MPELDPLAELANTGAVPDPIEPLAAYRESKAQSQAARSTLARLVLAQLNIEANDWLDLAALAERTAEADVRVNSARRAVDRLAPPEAALTVNAAIQRAAYAFGQAKAWSTPAALLDLERGGQTQRKDIGQWWLVYRPTSTSWVEVSNIVKFRADIAGRLRRSRQELRRESVTLAKQLGPVVNERALSRSIDLGFKNAVQEIHISNKRVFRFARQHREQPWAFVRSWALKFSRELDGKKVDYSSAVKSAQAHIALERAEQTANSYAIRREVLIVGVRTELLPEQTQALRRVFGRSAFVPSATLLSELAEAAMLPVESLSADQLLNAPSKAEADLNDAEFARLQTAAAKEFLGAHGLPSVSFASYNASIERAKRDVENAVQKLTKSKGGKALSFQSSVARKRDEGGNRFLTSDNTDVTEPDTLLKAAYRLATLVGEAAAYDDGALWLEILKPAPNQPATAWRVVRKLPGTETLRELTRENEFAYEQARQLFKHDASPDANRVRVEAVGSVSAFRDYVDDLKNSALLDVATDQLHSELHERIDRDVLAKAMQDGYNLAVDVLMERNEELIAVWQSCETNARRAYTPPAPPKKRKQAEDMSDEEFADWRAELKEIDRLAKEKEALDKAAVENGAVLTPPSQPKTTKRPLRRQRWPVVDARLRDEVEPKRPIQVPRDQLKAATTYVAALAAIEARRETIEQQRIELKDRLDDFRVALRTSSYGAKIQECFGSLPDASAIPAYADRIFEAAERVELSQTLGRTLTS